MEYKYTINDISETVKISKPSLYALIKKNSAFIKDNSVRRQRKIYYNQAAMDFFTSYYQPEATNQSGENQPPQVNLNSAEGQAEKKPVEGAQAEGQHKSQPNALERKIDALEAEIEALRKQLDASETEKKELLRQNGEVLLLLQMEKPEKQLYLPAPKKTLTDRVKSLFHKGQSVFDAMQKNVVLS